MHWTAALALHYIYTVFADWYFSDLFTLVPRYIVMNFVIICTLNIIVLQICKTDYPDLFLCKNKSWFVSNCDQLGFFFYESVRKKVKKEKQHAMNFLTKKLCRKFKPSVSHSTLVLGILVLTSILIQKI